MADAGVTVLGLSEPVGRDVHRQVDVLWHPVYTRGMATGPGSAGTVRRRGNYRFQGKKRTQQGEKASGRLGSGGYPQCPARGVRATEEGLQVACTGRVSSGLFAWELPSPWVGSQRGPDVSLRNTENQRHGSQICR